jgi:hypothetical protein
MKTWQLATIWLGGMALWCWRDRLPKWVGPVLGLCAAVAVSGWLLYVTPWQYSAAWVSVMAVLANAYRFPDWLRGIVGVACSVTVAALVGYVLYLMFTDQIDWAFIHQDNLDNPYRY